MKAYYEDVRAGDLKIGDMVKLGVWPAGKWAQRNADEFRELRYEDVLLPRQLPPERNPDVLMRALENLAISHDYTHEAVKDVIQQAIRELEIEAKR